MNERTLRPANVIAAAFLIGGVLIVAMPQHARSIVQLVIVTAAAAVALYALAANVPPSGWVSPFKWMSPFGRPAVTRGRGRGSHDLARIRSRFSGWRRSVEGGPPLPPETVRLLQPLVRSALGFDPDDEAGPSHSRHELTLLTRAILTADPSRRSAWFRPHPPNPPAVAAAVHRVLDELESLAGTGEPPPPIDPPHPRAP